MKSTQHDINKNRTVNTGKKSIGIFVLSILIASTIFTGCLSSAQKADDAQADVDAVREDLENVKNDTKENADNLANAAEWEAYKASSQVAIDNYETRIAELNQTMKNSGKTVDAAYQEKIAALEQRNKDLKAQMDAYENNQSDWEKFKREYDNNIDELGKALKEIGK